MNLRLLTALFISLAISACSENTSAFEKQYIDLRSVIEQAISTNQNQQPTFVKEVLIDGESETITTKQIDWSKELEVFLSADLNKRDYLNKYKIDSTKNQVKYSLLPEMESAVKDVTIFFDSTASISRINALLKTNNFLYDSERELSILFETNKLVSYEVSGWQQLFIGGKKQYSIRAKKRGA